MEQTESPSSSIFATEPIGRLIAKFAIPCVISLMIGDGGAAYLSLKLGEGDIESAKKGVGNAIGSSSASTPSWTSSAPPMCCGPTPCSTAPSSASACPL